MLGLAAVSHRARAGCFRELSADMLESGVFSRLTG